MLAVRTPKSQFEKVSQLLRSYEITEEKLQSHLDAMNRDQALVQLEQIAARLTTDINVMSKNRVHSDILLEASKRSTPQRVKLGIVQEVIRHLREI